MLELEQVVKHYRGAGEEVRAIDGVSLAVSPGEMLALHGPSGSGKTTLLKLAATLLAPERGTVRFDGVDLASFSEDDASDYLLRDVGFVYQNFRLMPRVSALENASIKLLLGGSRAPRGSRSGAYVAGAPRARRPHRADPRAALRRRAPAGRDRARPVGRSAADPRRRADRQPRQRPQPRDRRAARGDRARAQRRRAARHARHRGRTARRPQPHAARRRTARCGGERGCRGLSR